MTPTTFRSEQTIFYKCTRPDGRDFNTGTVDYAAALESGGVLAPDLADDRSFPGPGWLHLATVPTECVGVSWPCRLFEVEPVGEVYRRDDEHPHKIGCRRIRVLREVPAHRAFGPQGEHVAALIERCRTLTGDEAAAAAAWYAAWYAARYAARYAAWYAAWDAAWDAAAFWDAARALVLRDLIGTRPGWDQAAYDLLTGPWRQVIGPIHPDDAPMGDSDE